MALLSLNHLWKVTTSLSLYYHQSCVMWGPLILVSVNQKSSSKNPIIYNNGFCVSIAINFQGLLLLKCFFLEKKGGSEEGVIGFSDMRGLSPYNLCVLVFLLCFLSCCYGNIEKRTNNNVQVVGFSECSDCKENKIKNSEAFSGKFLTFVLTSEQSYVSFSFVQKPYESYSFRTILEFIS